MTSSPLQKRQAALAVDVLIEAQAWRTLPQAEDIVRRAIAFAATAGVEIRHPEACARARAGWGLCILLSDDERIARLNGQWRGQHKPTNVLSFPAPALYHAGRNEKTPLGDIAIAYETLAREAKQNGAEVSDHLSHLVVHGFLHLLGYDHHMDDEAERMERLERDILARMGVDDPYAARDADI
jgi:probable rRNA maturation factor